jgi:tRNA(Arg) A34 adenosine deaminase TadA
MHAVVHAEVNAIMFRNCTDLEGCTLYTTLFPCHECAKAIIQSGIKEIYYLTEYRDGKDTPGDYDSVWDDPNVEAGNKDKPTYVASRYLLQKYFTSGKHQKVELMNGRYVNCCNTQHACDSLQCNFCTVHTTEYASDIYHQKALPSTYIRRRTRGTQCHVDTRT